MRCGFIGDILISRTCMILTFFKNPEYQPFFALVGETFLMFVVLQLLLNIFGYHDYFLEQKAIWLAAGCLIGYLFGNLLLWLANKYFPSI